MPTQRQSYGFDAEDRKVYSVWLRRTIVAYGAIVMLGIALVAVQATTRTADTVDFTPTAVTMIGP